MLWVQISKHVCFWYSMLSSVLHVWVWTLYAWVLTMCCYHFSGDRFERRVCGGRRGLWIPGRRRPGTSQPRRAIYLMHIWILLLLYALLTLIPLLMHYILYCYWPLDSNSWWLSSTSQLDIILWDDTYCDLCNTSSIRDLMASINVFGKLVVEPKL
jgi:hypothetical protein